jgi:hypothetical protein
MVEGYVNIDDNLKNNFLDLNEGTDGNTFELIHLNLYWKD